MFRKKSLREKLPEIKRIVSPPINIPTGIPPEPTTKPQVAVFITHGMGQQVPFEALDAATEGLIQSANRHGNSINEIRSRTVLIDGVKTQRAEFDMRDARDRDVEVHVYEGYWAPITEGQVTLRDVMSFLFRAAFKGLRNSGLFNWHQGFERWIFDREVPFGCQVKAVRHLLILLCVVLSLVILNSVIAVVGGDKIIHQGGASSFSEPTLNSLTNVAGMYSVACLVFGGMIALLLWMKQWKQCPAIKSVWPSATFAALFFMWAWVAITIIAGLLITLLIFTTIPMPACISAERLSKCWLFPIWGFLFVASWYVKNLLVEYMGDVAAYVDSHSLDRFDDMRNRIKATVFEHAKAVYTNSQYEHIAMMGHSLGSAITYDTLNALINHDALNKNKLGVIERTRLLLTFGSPLDKLAFLFASQINNATATREALAATLQPLIQAYLPFRNIKWINVYSDRDIVSGKLDFYDDSQAANYSPLRAVKNVEDPDAKIPLAAHIEYWNNTTLFDELYENL